MLFYQRTIYFSLLICSLSILNLRAVWELPATTPMHEAAKTEEGCTGVLRERENGHSVNAIDSSYLTPLHWAVKRNNRPAAWALIRFGANVNPIDKTGKTPFDYCGKYDTEVEKLLMEYGAKKSAHMD